MVIVLLLIVSWRSFSGLNSIMEAKNENVSCAKANELVMDLRIAFDEQRLAQRKFFAGDNSILAALKHNTQSIRTDMDQLRTVACAAPMQQQIQEIATGLDSFTSSFLAGKELQDKRGSRDDGIYGHFRAMTRTLKNRFDVLNKDNLRARFLQIRRDEQDFILRGDEKYVGQFDENITVLRKTITNSPHLPDRPAINRDINAYTEGFHSLVRITQQITEMQQTLEQITAVTKPKIQKIEKALMKLGQESLKRIDDVSSSVKNGMWASILFAIVLSFLVGLMIVRQIVGGLTILLTSAQEIATGNVAVNHALTRIEGRDELGQLASSFAVMTTNLRELIGNLQTGATQLNTSTAEIATTAQESASSSAEQASTVTEVTTTTEEIRQTSESATENARQVMEIAEQALSKGQEGLESVRHSVGMMDLIGDRVKGVADKILRLSEQNSQIGNIIDTVNNLAEQSNLLAVNASIEAAKAGEHGRGFAVVANEVRNLAEQSKNSAQEIRAILGEIQKATESAVMATEESNKRVDDGRTSVQGLSNLIEDLATVLETTSDRARQITSTASQQSSGIIQIAEAMKSVDQAGQDNAASARRLEQAASEISALAAQLESSAARYKI